jgi:hypothetical protein
MRERIEKRLAELESELSVGARRLHELEREEVGLREALSRIGGAVIVLRELLGGGDLVEGGTEVPLRVEELVASEAR